MDNNQAAAAVIGMVFTFLGFLSYLDYLETVARLGSPKEAPKQGGGGPDLPPASNVVRLKDDEYSQPAAERAGFHQGKKKPASQPAEKCPKDFCRE